MAFRNGIDRNMRTLFSQYIDDYIPTDHIVRVYDKMIDLFKDDELGFEYNESPAGNPRYNFRTMLKILVYAYSQKIRSSRMIEKALYENIAFKWLSQDLRADHKTISEFRRNNKKVISNTLKSIIRTCKELDLIEGNYGTRIKGNASLETTWTKKKVEHLMEIHEANDKQEEGLKSYVKVDNIEDKIAQLREKKKRVKKIGQALDNTTTKKKS